MRVIRSWSGDTFNGDFFRNGSGFDGTAASFEQSAASGASMRVMFQKNTISIGEDSGGAAKTQLGTISGSGSVCADVANNTINTGATFTNQNYIVRDQGGTVLLAGPGPNVEIYW